MPVSSRPFLASSDKLSLTPQRKHHKMLKDGSGSEVWPEPVECLFVQGLKKYWESPWASYSRGRSRWRNQFLVDYLESAGVTRSKKQVASHIQVLRNMWKGEPQFHLVANGDSALRLRTASKSKSPSPIKSEEDSDSSPIFPTENIPLPSADPHCLPPLSNPRLPLPDPSQPFVFPSSHSSPLVKAESIHTIPSSSDLSDCGLQTFAAPPALDTLNYDAPFSYPFPITSPNRVSYVSIWADASMTPLTIPTNDYLPLSSSSSSPTPVVQVRLKIPPIDDLRCPTSLNGFSVKLSMIHPWSSSKTITRVFASGSCVSHHAITAQSTPSVYDTDTDSRSVILPESELSRCRWLDPSAQFRISQEIHVDDEPVAFFIYDLVRNAGSLPSAELVTVQATRRRSPGGHQQHHYRSQQSQMMSTARTTFGVPPIMPTSVSF